MNPRFWSKVDVRGQAECWPWLGRSDKGGYGRFQTTNPPGTTPKQKHWIAHRYALFLKLGRKIEGVVMHSCDNPACCNPAHLREGTYAENSADMVSKGRQALGDQVKNRARGERTRIAKLTADSVAQIRALSAQGWTATACALKFGVSAVNASMIIRRKTWRHVA